MRFKSLSINKIRNKTQLKLGVTNPFPVPVSRNPLVRARWPRIRNEATEGSDNHLMKQ